MCVFIGKIHVRNVCLEHMEYKKFYIFCLSTSFSWYAQELFAFSLVTIIIIQASFKNYYITKQAMIC